MGIVSLSFRPKEARSMSLRSLEIQRELGSQQLRTLHSFLRWVQRKFDPLRQVWQGHNRVSLSHQRSYHWTTTKRVAMHRRISVLKTVIQVLRDLHQLLSAWSLRLKMLGKSQKRLISLASPTSQLLRLFQGRRASGRSKTRERHL